MPFTGKATYTAGSMLPEIAEDVADIISIVSPYETPLLDLLGDSPRAATSTYHEWLEDSLLPNRDDINHGSAPGTGTAIIAMTHGEYFRVGDQVKADGTSELMLVTAISDNDVTFARGYGGTTPAALTDGQTIHILGNAALEGDDSPAVRFTNRFRTGNWTQIFTSSVRVSGSDLAVRKLSVSDELDYQKQERLRELLRDLENTVINGMAPATTLQGSSTVRRSMKGIIPSITSNVFTVGAGGSEGFTTSDTLTEPQLNLALRNVWENSASRVDTIVCNGFQKRTINGFITSSRAYGPSDESFRDMVSTYESDFGVCRVVLCRSMPTDSVLLLDSSRIDVLPLAGRSFHYKPLASTGDYEAGAVLGEYTLECRNEAAHAMVTGLSTS